MVGPAGQMGSPGPEGPKGKKGEDGRVRIVLQAIENGEFQLSIKKRLDMNCRRLKSKVVLKHAIDNVAP